MAKSKKPSKFVLILASTELVRSKVKTEFLPLFDHLINLAKHSQQTGYPQRAGRELKMARDLIRKYGARG
jgi:hypothetical protein